jgi:hypothetical protein
VTSAFLPEARAKAEVLALPEYQPVVVTHPTLAVAPEELKKRAQEAVPQILAILTGKGQAR